MGKQQKAALITPLIDIDHNTDLSQVEKDSFEEHFSSFSGHCIWRNSGIQPIYPSNAA